MQKTINRRMMKLIHGDWNNVYHSNRDGFSLRDREEIEKRVDSIHEDIRIEFDRLEIDCGKVRRWSCWCCCRYKGCFYWSIFFLFIVIIYSIDCVSGWRVVSGFDCLLLQGKKRQQFQPKVVHRGEKEIVRSHLRCSEEFEIVFVRDVF